MTRRESLRGRVVALVLVLLGAACPGCGRDPPRSAEAEAVQRVANQAKLDAPKILAHYRNGDGSPVDVFEAQLRFARERNLEGCPEDFKDAYEKANQSTREALKVARATQQTARTMRAWETIAGMEEPPTDDERKIRAVYREQHRASRYLKEVAARYGVQYGRRPDAEKPST